MGEEFDEINCKVTLNVLCMVRIPNGIDYTPVCALNGEYSS
jgi:hypothetical protein